MIPGFHVRKSRMRRRWYVELIGLNGETLSTSELLNSEATAYENIDAQLRAIASQESTPR